MGTVTVTKAILNQNLSLIIPQFYRLWDGSVFSKVVSTYTLSLSFSAEIKTIM